MTIVIKPKLKNKTTKVKIELSEKTIERLKKYQQYIGENDTDYIIEEAINQIFGHKPFKVWEAEEAAKLKAAQENDIKES